MIKPAFFPFTDIPPETAERLLAVFPKVVVYRPTAAPPASIATSRSGEISVRIPKTDDDADLLQRFDEINRLSDSLAGESKGADVRSLSRVLQADAGDERSVRRLASHIRSGSPLSEERNQAEDPDLQLRESRLFLLVAGAFDNRMRETTEHIDEILKSEQALFSVIHGEAPEPGPGGGRATLPPAADIGRYYTEKRLSAWANLLLADSSPPPVYITDSREVFDAVTDRAETLYESTRAACSPAAVREAAAGSGGKTIDEWVDGLRKTGDPPAHPSDEESNARKWTIHAARNISPRRCWGVWTSIDRREYESTGDVGESTLWIWRGEG